MCEKSKVRIMVLKIQFDLINFFKARFLLKWHPNLPEYYKFNCRNYDNLKISQCLISGVCLIKIRQLPDCSGPWFVRSLVAAIE